MPPSMHDAVRQPSLLDPTRSGSAPAAALADGTGHWTGRGQNFAVTWTRAGAEGDAAHIDSAFETMVLVLDAAVAINGDGQRAEAPPRSICLVPPGAWTLELAAGATCVVLSSLAAGQSAGASNEAAYADPDPRIAPVGAPYRPIRDADRIRILSIDKVAASPDKPRLKMLQSATMSINWVEYDGPRNRQALSPHSHTSFEQGSLALAGDFVHHLRVEWGPDADAWQEDRHVRLGSPSLMVVPVQIIHTSEGVGPGKHLLIDVFSPPRADFIAKGWVANAGDYAAPDAAS
ncbi:hypothetical protein GCM10007242_29540 [Pigmentiphaga litoralis]|uniref:hypothetical protein n=1 Tax=Pigmentiphaga litoralis TaxID=516702 RepID=UPI0016773CBB|nr:hypothetical protein [Pigmentiphaga litoralis]GGX20502.1 hypothetical protein GCM10007242_29540 [Pigmentiphaga litoralis]